MFVLILSRGYPRSDNKVLGIFEMDQAKALQSLGIKVAFLSTDLRSIRRWRKWGYEKKIVDGIEVYGMNIPLGRVKPSMIDRATEFSIDYLYKKVLKDHGQPDLVHGHFLNQGYAGSLLKEKYGLPLVITEHSSAINKEEISFDLIEKGNKTYKKADKLISVSPTLQKRIKEKFGVDSVFIPNIVDTEIFSYEDHKRGDIFSFVSTGHLTPIKDNETTIRAFYRAFEGKEDVELKIFGDGSERKHLEDLVESLGLGERVKFMGQCKRQEIADEYKKADAFVLASKSETFGVSYIEALASGLPVLATRCGGPEAFVDKANGIFCEVGDIEVLAENMKYMYENIDFFNGKAISEKTREEFSPNKIGEKIIEVYKEV